MTTGTKIGVLVVDDHPIMRLGVAAIINAQRDMRVCAQAGSGEEAVKMFKKHRPDITLMDLRLPAMSGLDALRAIRLDDPQAHALYSRRTKGTKIFTRR